jgi:hypothetical protein
MNRGIFHTKMCLCKLKRSNWNSSGERTLLLIHNPPLNYITNHKQLFVHYKLKKKTTKAASCRKNQMLKMDVKAVSRAVA